MNIKRTVLSKTNARIIAIVPRARILARAAGNQRAERPYKNERKYG